MILLIGAVALECPATVRDALTYHVPRVMHWLQQRSLSPYPTSIVRQLESAPGAELQTATLMLLTGDDWALSMPQWWAMLTCGLLASLLAERLLRWHFGKQELDGKRVRWCGLLAALIAVTLPAGVTEAISPLNDFLSAQWVMLLVVFGLLLIQEPKNSFYAAGAGAALALGVNNKPTMFLYAAPWVAALALWLLRKSWRMLVALTVVTAVLGLAANWPWMARNCQVFHHALGSEETLRIQPLSDHSPSKMAANIIRNLSLYSETPFDWSTSALRRVLGSLFGLAGEPLDDKGSVWGELHFVFPSRSSEVSSGDGFGTVMAALPVLLAMLFFPGKFKWNSPLLIYLGLILAGFALFSCYLRWQPWHARLHLPLFVLAAPFTGMVLGWVWNRWFVLAASLLLALNALLILCFNHSFPAFLLSNKPFQTREELYFCEHPELYAETAELAADIVRSGVTHVCLKIGSDTAEYPVWVCLRNRGFQGTIEHVFVDNDSAKLGAPYFDSQDAVILSEDVNPPRVPDFGLRLAYGGYDRWSAFYRGKQEDRLKLIPGEIPGNITSPQPGDLQISPQASPRAVLHVMSDQLQLLQFRCSPIDQDGRPITNNAIRLRINVSDQYGRPVTNDLVHMKPVGLHRDFPATSEQVLLECALEHNPYLITLVCLNPLSDGQRTMTLANFTMKWAPLPAH
jgi:4-amino-4-deoxy-L-arabinose transferase-like glycosyltransferase